ncbi:hypothetical protein BDR04DRAFT_292454 [Suillus decipiens]|nr:hypothetical protein BDR04DRAFT_292454 [Suillus decipiens]
MPSFMSLQGHDWCQNRFAFCRIGLHRAGSHDVFGGLSSCSVRLGLILSFASLTYSSVALCLLKPAVSSYMRTNTYVGFHLTRMLAGAKSDDRHIGARTTSMYFLCVSDSCASLFLQLFSYRYTRIWKTHITIVGARQNTPN